MSDLKQEVSHFLNTFYPFPTIYQTHFNHSFYAMLSLRAACRKQVPTPAGAWHLKVERTGNRKNSMVTTTALAVSRSRYLLLDMIVRLHSSSAIFNFFFYLGC